MRCGVCGHERQAEIEAAAGEPGAELLDVAVRFGVTLGGLTRHVTQQHPRAEASTGSPSEAPPAVLPRRRDRAQRAPTPRARASAQAPPSSEEAPPTESSPAPSIEDPEESAPATSRSEDLIRSQKTATTAREKVEKLVDSLQRLLNRIERDPEATVSMQVTALKALTAPIRLLGTFTGEIGASETRVASSPFYTRVRKAIVEALRKHPDAARDVIAALERVERGDAEEGEAKAA